MSQLLDSQILPRQLVFLAGSDPEDSIISVHVEATLVTKSGGWSANRPEQELFVLKPFQPGRR